jgi:hypothetical protein
MPALGNAVEVMVRVVVVDKSVFKSVTRNLKCTVAVPIGTLSKWPT